MSKKLKSAVKKLLHHVSELNVRVTKLEYPPKQEIELLQEKKELVVGKWYKGNVDFNSMIYITEIENAGSYNRIHGYGFKKSEWNDLCHLLSNTDHEQSLIEATSQEIESALIEEANRRYKDGDKLENSGINSKFKTLSLEISGNYSYHSQANVLEIKEGDGHVFKNGKWAEVIKNVDPYSEYRIKPEEKPKVFWKEYLIREANYYEIATNSLVKLCHGLAKDAGWHDKPRELGTMLALIHSEVSEAMEGFRKDLNDDHLTDRKMSEVELADAVIRIFDLAGSQGFDLGGALVEKLVYNTQRADHKIENRKGQNGKKF